MLTLLSALLGGVFRLAPEMMKLWDKKNDRVHELAMTEKEIEIAQLKVQEQMYRTDAEMHVSDMNALETALKEQGETARAGGKIVAAISALVRPVITYWLVVLYSVAKLIHLYLLCSRSATLEQISAGIYTEFDQNTLIMILSFWFVGRVWERAKK